MRELQRYPWPGNVRELRNVIERAVIVATGPQLVVAAPRHGERPMPQTAMTLTELEIEHIRAVLESTSWRVRGVRRRGGASGPQADNAREPDGQARHRAQEGQLSALTHSPRGGGGHTAGAGVRQAVAARGRP